MSTTIKLAAVAPKLLNEPFRYKVLYGGRGSGKSYAVADCLLILAYSKQCLVLCAREFQKSIRNSVHSLLVQRIAALGWSEDFHITREEIICTHNNSRFIFMGIRHNVDNIKSVPGITHLWIEEADTMSAESWRTLTPTIREDDSEIWITFNPKNPTDIIYKEFVLNTTPGAFVQKINYNDNPFFPKVLKQERKTAESTLDRDLYNHIWNGECLKISEAQIFKGKFFVEEFVVDYTFGEPIYGLDWGFSQDPTAAVQMYIKGRNLYISKEAVKVGLELDDTAKFIMERIPAIEKYVIRADSARPESISYVKRHGLSLIRAAKKGKGSVEDGIAFMKSFDKIIINPDCVHTIQEFTYYSYKMDDRSGDISSVIIDKFNHIIDACRYGLEPFVVAPCDYGKML